MFKRSGIILGGILLSCQLFAVPDNAIFMSRLKATGVQGFSPVDHIHSFTTHSSGGWDYLMAHSGTDSNDIIKDSLGGIILKGFDPGAPIDSFTAGSAAGWAYLIAHSGASWDTIIQTEWKGTWTQGHSVSGQVVQGFTSNGSNDSVWLMVTMGAVGIEETSDDHAWLEEELVTGLTAITPNPFRGRTVISYQLSVIGEDQKLITDYRLPLTIRIYDLSGRLVTTLIDESKEPGRYSLSWRGVDDKGRKLTTGVYFLRLTAGDFIGTRKVVVVR